MSVTPLQSSIDPNFDRLLAAHDDGDLLASFTAKRHSVAQRLAAGKALREKVPRAAHGKYEKNPDRADPIEILERQNRMRLPRLVPVRYARMLASPSEGNILQESPRGARIGAQLDGILHGTAHLGCRHQFHRLRDLLGGLDGLHFSPEIAEVAGHGRRITDCGFRITEYRFRNS